MLKNSQLIQHLQLIQSSEYPDLKQYVRKQLPPRKSYLNKLLTSLLKFHPDYELSDKEENDLLQKLIPGKRYEFARKKISRWSNELLFFVKDFLIQFYLETNGQEKEKLLRKIYLDKQGMALYQKSLAPQLSKLSVHCHNAEYHQMLYETNEEQLAAIHTEGYEYKLPAIPATIHHLEESFAWKRIRYNLDELNRTVIFNEDNLKNSTTFDKTSWDYLGQLNAKENRLYQCYLYVREALMEGQDEHDAFQLARRYLFENKSFFNPIDTNILLRQLLNISGRKLKAGCLNYLEQSFFLYKIGLQEKLFVYNSNLPLRLYINIAATADALRDFAWVAAFLNQYEVKLTGEYKEVVVDLAWAGHYFNQGSQNKSIDLLLQSENRLPQYHQLPLWFSLRRYSIDLRLQFELFSLGYCDCDQIDFAISRFSKYLERNQRINKATIILYQQAISFIKILTRLYNEKQLKTKKEQLAILKNLTKEIKKKDHFLWRLWFLSKVEGISL